MTFVRSKLEDTWHWHRKCSGWPSLDLVSAPSLPLHGRLCDECRSNEPVVTCEDAIALLRTQSAAQGGLKRLSVEELELIREEVRKWSDQARTDLEKLEAVLILARDRERSPQQDGGEPASLRPRPRP